ncbi:hypothetical protein PND93_02875 [Faecalicoccus pleomorphus]|uniref:hypothetical protein n=1 Tax=Faecalicoccus pleomorphus TaxID=1323 RepID=UPI00232D2E9A|nr:hypothetical protein [Faecalicoccus pleomorphus]MDB7990528.1 hypothetical protein [Faecalicoccus pleomorphus]
MSGGSYNYGYSTVEYTYVGEMKDTELNEMMKDLVQVLHDLEWYVDCDISEETYRETVTKFKSKWFKRRKYDIEALVNEVFENKKQELLKELEYMGK